MQRACDCCGEVYEAKRPNSRFLNATHRQAYARGKRPDPGATSTGTPPPEPNTDIADRLIRELQELEVFDKYEAAVVVGMAKQLDSGKIVGAAFVSQSKEIDRRMDALRLTAVKKDDPTEVILGRVAEKQAHLKAV